MVFMSVVVQMTDSNADTRVGENLTDFPQTKESDNDPKYKKFEELSVVKNSGKEDDLHRCSEPPKPLQPLLRKISELEPMATNDSLPKRYMRILSVVSLYW